MTAQVPGIKIPFVIFKRFDQAVIGLTAHDKVKRDRASVDWRYVGDGTVESAQIAGYWQRAENRQDSYEDRLTAADRTRINTFDNRVFGFAGDATLPVCITGGMVWQATVLIERGRERIAVPFLFDTGRSH